MDNFRNKCLISGQISEALVSMRDFFGKYYKTYSHSWEVGQNIKSWKK